MNGKLTPRTHDQSRLLVLCGLDGSGKSTQAEHLADRMQLNGYDVVTLWSRWEPALSAPLIRLAKRRLSSVKNAETADYANFTAAKQRAMHSAWKRALWQFMVWSEYSVQINSRLLSHRIARRGVICDRYVYDTIVDIAINFSAEPDDIRDLCRHPLLSLFPRPRQVICIDIDPQTGADRKQDGTPAKYLADRRQYYLAIARALGFAIIDGNDSIERTADAIWQHTSQWRSTLRRSDRSSIGGGAE